MEFVLEARGEDADHALMPDPRRTAAGCSCLPDRLLPARPAPVLHVGFDAAPFAVERVQLLRDLRGLLLRRRSAGNSMPRPCPPAPGGIQARSDDEAQIVG